MHNYKKEGKKNKQIIKINKLYFLRTKCQEYGVTNIKNHNGEMAHLNTPFIVNML